MPSVSINSPSSGGQFSGNASGMVSPGGGSVVVKFWQTDPGDQNPPPTPAAQANATFDDSGTGWSVALSMSGVAATTTGFLRAEYTTGGQTFFAVADSLTWAP